jgi:hypothetical protein
MTHYPAPARRAFLFQPLRAAASIRFRASAIRSSRVHDAVGRSCVDAVSIKFYLIPAA